MLAKKSNLFMMIMEAAALAAAVEKKLMVVARKATAQEVGLHCTPSADRSSLGP